MSPLDAAILTATALLAVVGWRQGFLVGALGLAGFVGGALAGSRAAGAVSDATYAPLFGLLGALVVGGTLAIAFEGLGLALRRRLAGRRPLRAADGALGATLLAALALGIAWVGGTVALQTPGTAASLRRAIRASAVLGRLDDVLPPAGPLLNALARFDPFPSIAGPAARVAAPPPGLPRRPAVRAAAASVVRVTGNACGLGVEGSGWVTRGGLVVTNAHVVAGEDDTAVQVRGKGPSLDADVVALDVRDDLAVLRVSGLRGVPGLELADDADAGTGAAILGFPRNGPYDVRAARLGATQSVLSQDARGDGPVRRRITSVRGLVRPGNSGGPVVDASGRVLATVFATQERRRRSAPATGYAVGDDAVRDLLARPLRGAVSTGACVG